MPALHSRFKNYTIRRNNKGGFTFPGIERSEKLSTRASIAVAVYFTVIILGVLSVAIFSTRKNRADAASLAASTNARRSPCQRHKNETLSLLHDSPRDVYMEWAARTKVSFPRRLPTDPLCMICLEIVIDNDRVVALACLHFFHSKCFNRMCAAGITRCPLCQRSLFTMHENGL